MSYKRKSKVRWTITIISFVMSIIMFGAFVFGLFTAPPKTTDNVGALDYVIGSIDDSGKMIESYKSIYTKDMHSVSGLKVEVEKDSSFITYKVVFYDEDKNYISATEALANNYDETLAPEGAEYFRVVVTPNQVDGEDVVITALNIKKYSKQIAITYNV